MTLRIELPWPAKENSPNYQGKLRLKMRAKKEARHNGYWAAYAALDANRGRVLWSRDAATIPVRITFHPPTRQRRDLDNFQAAVKHELDGIAEALQVDDRLFRPVSDWGDVCKPGKVIVEIG